MALAPGDTFGDYALANDGDEVWDAHYTRTPHGLRRRTEFPHGAMTIADLVMENLEPARRLRSLVDNVPQVLDDLLAAMLDPDPEHRPPNDAICEPSG